MKNNLYFIPIATLSLAGPAYGSDFREYVANPTLASGQVLPAGSELHQRPVITNTSDYASFPQVHARLQADGDFVLSYQLGMILPDWQESWSSNWPETVLWAHSQDNSPRTWDLTGTAQATVQLGFFRLMQTDGNLVVYDKLGRPWWASNTAGHPGAYLQLDRDNKLRIRDTRGNVLWTKG